VSIWHKVAESRCSLEVIFRDCKSILHKYHLACRVTRATFDGKAIKELFVIQHTKDKLSTPGQVQRRHSCLYGQDVCREFCCTCTFKHSEHSRCSNAAASSQTADNKDQSDFIPDLTLLLYIHHMLRVVIDFITMNRARNDFH